jgi:hypothetical protein
MWIPAPGKLAVIRAFGNVGVPLDRRGPDLVEGLISPERGSAGVKCAPRRGLQIRDLRAGAEDLP